MLNMKHLLTNMMSCKSPFVLQQVMMKNDCIQHGMQYYDWRFSKVCKDDEWRESSEEPFVDTKQ